eukprot:3496973-Prymnesium_polylepis.1
MKARGTVASFARPRTRAAVCSFASAVPVRRPVTHTHLLYQPSIPSELEADMAAGRGRARGAAIPRRLKKRRSGRARAPKEVLEGRSATARCTEMLVVVRGRARAAADRHPPRARSSRVQRAG